MVKDDKIKWLIYSSIILVPLYGIFGVNIWEIQSNILFFVFSLLAVFTISGFDRNARIKTIWFIFGFFVINSIQVLLQLLNIDFFFHDIRNYQNQIPLGFLASKNQLGLFSVVTLPIVIYCFPILAIFSIIGLVISKTSSCFIALYVGTIVYSYYFFKKEFKKILLLLTIILSLFFWKVDSPSGIAVSERYLLYKNTLISAVTGKSDVLINKRVYKAECNPIFGFGNNSFIKISPYNQNFYIDKDYSHRYFHAHNDYLEIFFEYGYLGLCFLIWFVLYTIISFIKAYKTRLLVILFCSIIIQLVSALFIFTIYTPVNYYLFLIIYGLYLGEKKLK